MRHKWTYDPGLDPSLDWTGKFEEAELSVPVLPLFDHERVDPSSVVPVPAVSFFHPGWENRLLLGDSLVVMTALLEYEGLGGQVQTVFMDPPYGVKFGSNFQPFVRSRDVKHDDPRFISRDPEAIKAYRDTWELGIHSYLSYLRARLLVSRDLLAPTGAIFVQIGEENVHRVRCLLDEVFGAEAYVATIPFRKKTMPLGARFLDGMVDYLLWYARDPSLMKYRQLYQPLIEDFHWKAAPDGRRYRYVSMKAPGYSAAHDFAFSFEGVDFRPPPGGSWITTLEGMTRLSSAGRLAVEGRTLVYRLFWDDFPLAKLTNLWTDTVGAQGKRYVVQTNEEVVARCLLMTSDPGDLVLDPTCGSGTTALVAERWGRKWISIDTGRVPLALARERLLAASHPAWRLASPDRGVAGGFICRKIPRITLRTIAAGEEPETAIVVDDLEREKGVRVTGPFRTGSTGPAANGEPALGSDDLFEALRRVATLRLPGGRTVKLTGVRTVEFALAPTLRLAEAGADGRKWLLALGPLHGSVSEELVDFVAGQSRAGGYDQAAVVGVAFSPQAAQRAATGGVLLVHASTDLQLGSLLEATRASQIFAVTGAPDVTIDKLPDGRFQVRLEGLDVFDPVRLEVDHVAGSDVPGWFLDSDHDGAVFRATQAHFPRTRAWAPLRKALGGDWDEAWGHGALSSPFEAGVHRRVAIKAVDDRGHELVAIRDLP